MLNTAKTLRGYKIASRDGEIGTVKEFYFDDQHWTIRYLVADTGNWLTGRVVLISPHALVGVKKAEQHVVVDLTKKQIEESPSLESDKPVSRQFEEAYLGYYGYSPYWVTPYMWGPSLYMSSDYGKWVKSTNNGEKSWDPHLRSTQDVRGHRIQATDGEIGHVEDFIIDDETWEILYLIVDTRHWWSGKKVLISTQWIERVSWDDANVFINLTIGSIKQSPEYTEESMLTRDYETKLHRHYNRIGHWENGPTDKKHAG